jgi:Tol biopolymer transport system component
MATWNRLGSSWPKGRSRFVAASTAAGLAVCLGALVLAPSAPATFPGKNGKIAFSYTERGGSFPVVYTMRRDGSHKRRLATGDSPAFSPSGRKIVFHPRHANSLNMMRANGTHRRRIPHSVRGFEASFAPGGKKIVFSRITRQRSSILTVRIDGSHRMRIRRGASGGEFSPNGKWIAFNSGNSYPGSAPPHAPCNIGLMRTDGSHVRFLTDTGGSRAVCNFGPSFSPHGHRIVFSRYHQGASDPTEGIYSIRLDGTHLRHLYTATRNTFGATGEAVFSPDGRKIVFSRQENQWKYSHLSTMRPDGSHLRRLSRGPINGRGHGHEEPSWGVRP